MGEADKFNSEHTMFMVTVKNLNGVFQWTMDSTGAPEKNLDWRYSASDNMEVI